MKRLLMTSSMLLCAGLGTAFAQVPDLRVHVVSTEGYESADLEKLARVTHLIERVVGSEEFWRRARERDVPQCNRAGHRYTYTALDNDQVLAVLAAARENGSDSADGVIDLRLVLAPDHSGEVGHTDPGPLGKITTGAATFRGSSDAAMAGHLVHEWTHTLGFTHPFLRRILPGIGRNRHACTVPYAIGNLVEELAERAMN